MNILTRLIIATLIMALFAPTLRAVDGIAVSTQWRVWFPFGHQCGDIMRYDIRNSDVVSSRVLLDGAGGNESKARVRYYYPTISRDGRLLAFARVTSDSGFFVAAANIDGSNVRNLVRLSDYTECPVDFCRIGSQDWVYYKGANAGEIRRVDARDPSRDELVVKLATGFWQWEFSADGSRLHAGAGSNPNRSRFQLPCDGSIGAWNKAYEGGCGTALSPSGNAVCYFNGVSGHMIHDFVAWDRFQNPPDTRITWIQVSDWNINTPQNLCTNCSGAGYTDSHPHMCLGCAGEGHRWSCNSDKWMCILMTLDGTGWSGFCGANQVIFNYSTQTSINVSRNPRACVTESSFYGTPGVCDKDAGNSQYKYNDCGDFWVSGPIDDVNPDLRFNVGGKNRTPSTVGENSPRIMRTGAETILSIMGACAHRVSVADPAGRVLAVFVGNGPAMYQLPRLRGTGTITIARGGLIENRQVWFAQ